MIREATARATPIRHRQWHRQVCPLTTSITLGSPTRLSRRAHQDTLKVYTGTTKLVDHLVAEASAWHGRRRSTS